MSSAMMTNYKGYMRSGNTGNGSEGDGTVANIGQYKVSDPTLVPDSSESHVNTTGMALVSAASSPNIANAIVDNRIERRRRELYTRYNRVSGKDL